MTFMDQVWEFLDNAWFLLTVVAAIVLTIAVLAVPVELAVVIYELRQMRAQKAPQVQVPTPCHCERIKFPHVLPRFRDE